MSNDRILIWILSIMSISQTIAFAIMLDAWRIAVKVAKRLASK
jgi:hypothetical protein